MSTEIEKALFKQSQSNYGENYHNHLFEQYKMYVDMADKISNRRQSANSFFLSVNTAVVALISYVQLGQKAGESLAFYWLIGLAGMLLCFTWFRLIRSYKDLNAGKFKVINVIEQHLPLAPFDAEWESLKRGNNPKIYRPFTNVEMG